jgi:xylitol oxidase
MKMNKREFLKVSGLMVAGGLLRPLSRAQTDAAARTNWAGNYKYAAHDLVTPRSVEELQNLIRNSTKIKALGARHSFNAIADIIGTQVSLKNFDHIRIDEASRTVTVGAGVAYGQVAPVLQQRGFALHNLASLPHISVAGACSTGTHGSGSQNGNLSTAVSGIDMVKADGEPVHLSRAQDGDAFRGAVVGLGALGIMTSVTLDLQPAFDVAQTVYQDLSFLHLEKHLEEVFSSGYSVSLFTDWQGHRATQVWIKRRVHPGEHPEFQREFFGAKAATRNLHPLADHSAENCTEQMGIPGPWYERLPHFRMNFTPSSGAELQSEYFVPRERAYEAILAVEKLRDQITPLLFISELRTIDGDDLWMSPCYQRPSMAIHFTWKPEWDGVKEMLPRIEDALAPFAARPHWAKLFTMPPAKLEPLYPKLSEFKTLAQKLDPSDKLRNPFLNGTIYGAS